MLPAADTTETAVRAAAATFALAIRLASPFLLVAIVWHVAIGLLARLVPRLQVYFVVMPGQILGGILMLAVLATSLLTAWELALRSGFAGLPGS
jgi:flagellar biosynthetic protein FliR